MNSSLAPASAQPQASLAAAFFPLGAGLLALAWLLPGHAPPWLTFKQELIAALGASLAGVATWGRAGGRVRWPGLAWVALAAAGIPLIQLLAGQIHFVSDAVLAAAYLAGFGLCLAAGATLARRGEVDVLGILMGALAIAAVVSTVLALMQWLHVGTGAIVEPGPDTGRVYAHLGQPNHLATALAMGLCAVLLGHARGRVGPLGAALLVALLGFGLVMSQSRTAWMFVAGLVVWLLVMKRRAGLRIPAGVALAGAALFALAVLGWEGLNPSLGQAALGGIEARATQGVSRRLAHLQLMWDALGQSPWFGYGWTQVGLAQQAAVLGRPAVGEQTFHSHNLFLDLLLWNGLPLGLVLVAALVAWFVRQLWICRDANRALALGALGAVFLHAMVEYPLDYAHFLFPVGLLMGALDGFDPPAPGLDARRATLALPAAALCGLALWVAAEYLAVEAVAEPIFQPRPSGAPARRPPAPVPRVALLDFPREQYRFMATPPQRSDDPAYLPWVREVAMRDPRQAFMLRHALAAGLNRQPDEARRVLERFCHMYPAEQCDAGRAAWGGVQLRYPELGAVDYPATPPELRPVRPTPSKQQESP